VDIETYDEGTLTGFEPVTEAAQEWFDENVQSEGWQWLGGILWVDHRFANALIEGAAGDGLEVA
jgi:hypothetical protein